MEEFLVKILELKIKFFLMSLNHNSECLISISLETAKECLYHFSRKDLSQACIDELNEIWLDEQSVLELSSRLEESNPIDE